MNDIPQRQNEELALARLAASRLLYSRAKVVLGISTVVSVPIPIVFALVAAQFETLKPYVAAWGIVATFLILFFERWQKNCINRAVLVQEKSDCDLLGIAWNRTKAGAEPAPEDIAADAAEFSRSGSLNKLKDWYPSSTGRLPMSLARIVCQRVNCTWEKRARYTYANFLISVLVALVLTIVLAGLATKPDLAEFVLLVLAPLSPAAVLLTRLFFDHRDAGQTSERLAEGALEVFRGVASGEVDEAAATVKSRTLQDQIYDRRRTAPLVYDWIYELLRDGNEAAMNRGTEALVAEAAEALAARSGRSTTVS